MTTATTTTQPVRIVHIVELDSHCLELLEDGSVDIVDTDRADEYTHLNPEEARQLFPSLAA